MTIKELKQYVDDKWSEFITNHFCHLRKKVDQIYIWLIGFLIALVLNLIGVIVILVRNR